VPELAPLVPKAAAAADGWSRLAVELKAVSERTAPDFERAASIAAEVASAERALWESAATV